MAPAPRAVWTWEGPSFAMLESPAVADEALAFLQRKRIDVVAITPRISEKSAVLSTAGRYVFDVPVTANKVEIRKAVEALYGVKVKSVNTLVRKGKVKRFKGTIGKQSDVKKAIVTLPSDQKSKAIGKNGINIRLASMLTGYTIELNEVGGTIQMGEKAAEEKKEGISSLEALFGN